MIGKIFITIAMGWSSELYLSVSICGPYRCYQTLNFSISGLASLKSRFAQETLHQRILLFACPYSIAEILLVRIGLLLALLLFDQF